MFTGLKTGLTTLWVSYGHNKNICKGITNKKEYSTQIRENERREKKINKFHHKV